VTVTDDEEARAELWRQQQRNRVSFQMGVWLGLQAPPGPRQEVLDGWMPLLLAALERQNPTDPWEDP